VPVIVHYKDRKKTYRKVVHADDTPRGMTLYKKRKMSAHSRDSDIKNRHETSQWGEGLASSNQLNMTLFNLAKVHRNNKHKHTTIQT